MSNHEIIILANSLKHHQHCVAGKLIDGSQWVRPVSNEHGAELSHEQAKCQNPHGKFNVKPLQKVIIGLERHVPLVNQPENYLIDDFVWQQNFRINETELTPYLDSPVEIWGSGDRVSYQEIQSGRLSIPQSLYLVKVNNLNLYMNQFDKRRANFEYNNITYDLAVTDPNFDDLLANPRELQGILCISLGEEYQGNCYKLIATIL